MDGCVPQLRDLVVLDAAEVPVQNAVATAWIFICDPLPEPVRVIYEGRPEPPLDCFAVAVLA